MKLSITKENFLKNPEFYYKFLEFFDYNEIKSLVSQLTPDELCRVAWIYPGITKEIPESSNMKVYLVGALSCLYYNAGDTDLDHPYYIPSKIYEKHHPTEHISDKSSWIDRMDSYRHNICDHSRLGLIIYHLQSVDMMISKFTITPNIESWYCSEIDIQDSSDPDLRAAIQDFPDYLMRSYRPPLSLQFLRWNSGILPLSLEIPIESPEKYHNFPHFDVLFRFQ